MVLSFCSHGKPVHLYNLLVYFMQLSNPSVNHQLDVTVMSIPLPYSTNTNPAQ